MPPGMSPQPVTRASCAASAAGRQTSADGRDQGRSACRRHPAAGGLARHARVVELEVPPRLAERSCPGLCHRAGTRRQGRDRAPGQLGTAVSRPGRTQPAAPVRMLGGFNESWIEFQDQGRSAMKARPRSKPSSPSLSKPTTRPVAQCPLTPMNLRLESNWQLNG